MLQWKAPTGRFGQTGRFFDFLFTWGGLNIVLVKLLLGDLLNAPVWLRVTAWTALGLALFWGFYLSWTPRRPGRISLPGDNTVGAVTRVNWEIPQSTDSR